MVHVLVVSVMALGLETVVTVSKIFLIIIYGGIFEDECNHAQLRHRSLTKAKAIAV